MTDETPAERPRPRPRPGPSPSIDLGKPAVPGELAAPPVLPSPSRNRRPDKAALSAAPAASSGGGAGIATWRWVAMGVGVALVAALAVLIVLVVNVRSDRNDHNAAADRQSSRLAATENARTEALASARTRVKAMLTYAYTALGTYQKQAPTNAVGRFKSDFSKLVDQVVVPAATRQHISTDTTVKNAGVVTASPDQVVVLVLLDQATTTNGKASSTQVTGSRVNVTMSKVHGSWYVSDLKTV